MIAVVLLAILFLAVFSLLNFNLTTTRLCRENTRATQILLDKMECLRLYRWQQLTNPAVLATSFTNWTCDPANAGAAGQGIQYIGDISVTTPVMDLTGTTYSSDIALVTVRVSWNSWNTNLTHTRSMSTYFSRIGIGSPYQPN